MTRRTLVWVLGGLWLLDALLQMQPGMFTMAMVQAVMQPTIVGQPGWVQALLRVAIDVLSWNIRLTNLGIVAVQLALGVAIVGWGERQAWPFVLSLIWSGALWVFGQGLGGILAPGASLLSGAPGSAVLYALLTWACWPGARAWPRRGVVAALGGVWALGALLQAEPVLFSSSGLSGLATGLAPGQPRWLAAVLGWVGSGLAAHPVSTNAGLVVLLALIAAGIWVGGRWRRPALAVSVVLAALAWIFGQAFGMLLTGMGTDPNTAPLLGILAAYAWTAESRQPAAFR